MVHVLSLALALTLSPPALQAPAETPKGRLSAALARFDRALPGYEADVQAQADYLRKLLTDYYLHKDDLTESEGTVVETLLSDLGLGAFDTRSFHSKPVAEAPAMKPAPPKSRPAPWKSPAHAPKIAGLRAKPVFGSGSHSLRRGEVGFVTLTVGERTKQIVEVPGVRALDPSKRAATIAARFRAAAAADPLWWSKLRTGRGRGEVFLTLGASGVPLVTADRAFATMWGETPEGLAARLRTQIRNTFDDMSATFLTRGDDERDAAISLRQKGDAKPTDAEAYYKAAIAKDPSYLVPYLRLAETYRDAGRADEAKAILRQAAAAQGMSAEDRKAATDAMKG